MKRVSFLVASVLCATWSSAQTPVDLHAVTGGGADKLNPDVRLRWQIKSGWIPAGGLKLYRVRPGARELVVALPAPTDAVVDSLLEPAFKGRNLIQKASGISSGLLDFGVTRPPSAVDDFVKRRTLLEEIRTLEGPGLPRIRRSEIKKQILAIKPPATTTVVRTLSADALTLRSRAELHIAAFAAPNNARLLSLGATDTAARAGETVTYQLVGVNATGGESAAIGLLKDFRVTPPQLPPTPTGILFSQDEDSISLRWNRLPSAIEQDLLQANYIIRRATGGGSPITITPKPVLILDLDGNREPATFFTDTVALPGPVTYQVFLRDGFGRESQPGVVSFTVADWRRPRPSRQVGASLGFALRQSIISSFKQSFMKPATTTTSTSISIPTSAAIVGWTRVSSPENLAVTYNIYRYDLDNVGSLPVKVTPTPIVGTPMTVVPDTQMDNAIDLLYRDEFDHLRADIDALRSRPAATATEIAARDRAAAIASAKLSARIKTLKAQFTASPPLQFNDLGIAKDHRYQYAVTAVYPTGLESAENLSTRVDVPEFTLPASVGEIGKKFTASTGAFLGVVKAPLKSTVVPFAGRQILQRNLLKQTNPTVSRTPIKLVLRPNDFGGTVELTWPARTKKGVVFRVRRQFAGSDFTDVGITEPGATVFRNQVPRSRERDYVYEVTPISRWNVVGRPTLVTVTALATMPPDEPNLLSVRPGAADGTVVVTVERHSSDQGVAKYVFLRDGTQAGVVNYPASGSTVTFTDTGLQPGPSFRYAVRAETAAGVKSGNSPEMNVSALKTSVATPANVVATATAKGVQVTWAAVPGVKYVVKRKVGTGPYVIVGPSVAGSSFLDTFAIRGVSYSYQVVAVDAQSNASLPGVAAPVVGL